MSLTNPKLRKVVHLLTINWLIINMIYKIYGSIVIGNLDRTEWLALGVGVICLTIFFSKSILDIYALIGIYLIDLLGLLPIISIRYTYVLYWDTGFELVIRVISLIITVLLLVVDAKELGIISEES